MESEVLTALNSCIIGAKWRLKPSSKRLLKTDVLALLVHHRRLKPSSKRCLKTDVLALCTGLRAVVLLDYGGKVLELLDRLSALVSLIHKMMLHAEQNIVTSDLLSVQKLFSSLFPVDVNIDLLPAMPSPMATPNVEPSESMDTDMVLNSDQTALHSSEIEIVDLSSMMNDSEVTTPTLNG